MPEGRQPRGVTPRPRSGTAAGRRYPTPQARGQGRQVGGDTPRPKPEARGGRWEEIPHAPSPRPGAAGGRSYPTPEARGSGGECQVATVQERPRGATPRPRSSGCVGTGGPRIAIPHSRSGGEAVRRYPSSKVKSRGCALLEQP